MNEAQECALVEEIRGWVIEMESGLTSQDEIVARADDRIRDLDAPPDVLIRVSMRESVKWIPRIDLVISPVKESDCPRIARLMFDRLSAGEISLHQVGFVAHKMAMEHGGSGESGCQFSLIATAIDLVEDGSGDILTIYDDVLGALWRIAGGDPFVS